MKSLCFIGLFICFSITKLFAQQADTSLFEVESTFFYYITKEGNNGLITFLHGGINAPIFESNTRKVELPFLLENNDAFVSSCIANGYDLLIPIANDRFNWLNQTELCHQRIQAFLNSSSKKYTEYYISGFSDGGTGSFKLFYTYPSDYEGLIVFNAYPFHKNFASTIDYSTVNDKKIVFLGTLKDRRVPYEFMLTEYVKQKQNNSNTFIHLIKGKHRFVEYGVTEFKLIMDVLNDKIKNTKTDSRHGFIKNDSLVTFYPFRRKIVRQYSFGNTFFKQNKEQKNSYK